MYFARVLACALALLAGSADAQRRSRWRSRWRTRTITYTSSATQAPPKTTAQPPRGAQQSLYGQCGGQDWAYATACPAGAHCDSQSQWYSQCLPNEAQKSSNPTIVTKTLTTIYSVTGPAPTVVTTYITYLTPTQKPVIITTITVVPDDPIWEEDPDDYP